MIYPRILWQTLLALVVCIPNKSPLSTNMVDGF